jgi:mycothiol S-conjugate amidase
LLAVHAHPDDESSKGAGTIARYTAQGIRCVLVSCTGGEAGEMRDLEAPTGDVGAVRADELRRAVEILGYEATHLLGYRDSGVDGAEPDGFATRDPNLIVSQLVSVFRREEPDVVVTYDPGYAAGHPDHLRSYEAAYAAFDAAGGAGGPSKLYGCRTHSPGRLRAMHDWLTSTGGDSPYERALAADPVDATITRIDIADYLPIARRALLVHRSQVSADDPWFFSVPVDVMRRIHPFEDYVLLRSRVPAETAGRWTRTRPVRRDTRSAPYVRIAVPPPLASSRATMTRLCRQIASSVGGRIIAHIAEQNPTICWAP